jgi:hypothetical protein
MTFEELWKRVDALHILPDTAIAQIPGILSSTTKDKLSRMTAEEVGKIVLTAIEEINHGSVAPLEELILKRL